jgi:hypothetical protein
MKPLSKIGPIESEAFRIVSPENNGRIILSRNGGPFYSREFSAHEAVERMSDGWVRE